MDSRVTQKKGGEHSSVQPQATVGRLRDRTALALSERFLEKVTKSLENIATWLEYHRSAHEM